MNSIKNIIFDLGNVLYDINFDKMYRSFTQLGIPHFENHFTLNKADSLFLDLEMGRINSSKFYEGFRHLYGLPIADLAIRDAWNSLLIGFRKESIDWIRANNTQFRCFLYSNTNSIHYNHFIPQFEKDLGGSFEALFVTPYYSHQMGQRKPDPSSFQYILDKEGLLASETIFIDDHLPNIHAAHSLGISVCYLEAGMRIEKHLKIT